MGITGGGCGAAWFGASCSCEGLTFSLLFKLLAGDFSGEQWNSIPGRHCGFSLTCFLKVVFTNTT